MFPMTTLERIYTNIFDFGTKHSSGRHVIKRHFIRNTKVFGPKKVAVEFALADHVAVGFFGPSTKQFSNNVLE